MIGSSGYHQRRARRRLMRTVLYAVGGFFAGGLLVSTVAQYLSIFI